MHLNKWISNEDKDIAKVARPHIRQHGWSILLVQSLGSMSECERYCLSQVQKNEKERAVRNMKKAASTAETRSLRQKREGKVVWVHGFSQLYLKFLCVREFSYITTLRTQVMIACWKVVEGTSNDWVTKELYSLAFTVKFSKYDNTRRDRLHPHSWVLAIRSSLHGMVCKIACI